MPRPRQTISPAYAPCPHCGGMVLSGETPAGRTVALDTQGVCYAVLWPNEAPRPTLHESRAYPVHHCCPALTTEGT